MPGCLLAASTAPAVLQAVEIAFNTLIDLEACGVKHESGAGSDQCVQLCCEATVSKVAAAAPLQAGVRAAEASKHATTEHCPPL